MADILITMLVSLLASSGFWIYLDKRQERKSMQTDLLIGLAHDRIIAVGLTYISKGFISQEEYENLHDYLYKPYTRLGGNGSAKRIMAEIDKLPIKQNPIHIVSKKPRRSKKV